MCGIAGIIGTRPGTTVDADLLARMNQVQRHRGPDDGDQYVTPPNGPIQAGIAMRRLSIIDLAGGHQPMANEDETVRIVFNGEIYNHAALRSELEAKGHRFATRSDTEAILHGYEEWGGDVVHRLRGMFAFAIIDERRGEAFLARDPVGIKPLYWTALSDRLLFGSEIKCLLRDSAVPRRVDREGLHHYLTYLYVPAPGTLFEGIRQLPPGHRMSIRNGEVRVEEYWTGPRSLLDGPEGPPISPDELWKALRESVEAHMLSDVPVGAFLSGGLDSSIVVALMAEISSHPVRTFSIGFSSAGLYNELPYARQVAKHFKTEHHERDVRADAVGLLPEIIRHLDEPLADASVIPNYLVAQLAREHVTVSLTGIGGDELFGGYRRYYGDQMARRWQRVPRAVRRGVLLPALRMVPASGDTKLGDASRLVQKFLEPLDLSPEERYLAWNAHFSESAKAELYAGAVSNGASTAAMLGHFDRVKHRPFADRAMFVDVKSYLPGDPLFLSDRMTMAHSLEARVPFVDPEVMEFAARIPLAQKIQGHTTKLILRQALAGHVPEEIIRRPKRGFGTPIDLWMRGELAGFMDQLLGPKLLRERGYFRPEYVQWLREQQSSGKRDFSQHLWALLVFELWHRAYIDADHSDRQNLSFEDLGLAAIGSTSPTPNAQRPTPATPIRNPQSAIRNLNLLMVADVDPVHVIGGAERMLNEHACRLAERGHRVTVLTRRENPEYPAEEVHRGVRVVRHPVRGGGAVGFIRSVLREGGAAFARLSAEEPFDLINVHQPLAGAAVIRCPESRGIPVLYTYLSPWADEYRVRAVRRSAGRKGPAAAATGAWIGINTHLRQRMEHSVVRRSDRVLVLSKFTCTQLRDFHAMPEDQPVIIPGGVNTDRFSPPEDRQALRRELGLAEGLLFLTVRNLVPRMGLDALIDAMRPVADAHPEVTLVIGGSGPLRESLEAQVRRLGLERNVRFAGFIPEALLPGYYGAADLFILPTRCLEGFGLVTVEALACGTPALGTPIGGTQEILSGFGSEFLFAGTSSEEMAARILERVAGLRDPALRERCRRFVLDRYGWDVLIPQVEALMGEMVLA
jgi:asparagine synthase (glutamine-hydrolysing)